MAVNLTYSPLNEAEDEIRLVKIAPYALRDSLVHCTLETVSLRAFTPSYQAFASQSNSTGRKRVVDWKHAHYPRREERRFTWGDYAALSYVWGSPTDTRTMILNDRQIPVQKNLEIALRALSRRADFHGNHKLWIDALCINQHDLLEQSHQIGRMKMIYAEALSVVAWLDEEAESSDSAIALLQFLSEVDCGEVLERRLREDPEYLGIGCWSALHELMNRPYWYRLWIIQEVVLGSCSVVLRCGQSSIEWSAFCRGVGFLFEYLWTVKDDLMVKEQDNPSSMWLTTSLHLVFRDLWALSLNEERGGGDYLSFGQLLDLAGSGGSQDTRDKVYGLVGMMEPVVAKNVLPDYTLPVYQVFAAIAKTYICAYGNLEPIREGSPWGNSGSPTWAADWTWNGRIRRSRLVVDIWGPFWRPKGMPPVFRSAMQYAASGKTPMDASFSDDGLLLTCRGFIVDEIDGLGAAEYGYFTWDPSSIHQPKSDKNAYDGTEGIVEALWRTLISDRVAGGVRANERHRVILNMPSNTEIAERQFKKLGWIWLSNQEGYYFRWSRWRLANRNFQIMGKPLDHYFSEAIPDNASEYDYTEAYSCNNRTGQGRRFLTTMDGRLGWGIDNMYGDRKRQLKSGDKIAIIFGCSTPIVIRPAGSNFQVLGEAYIHGLMDEEALEFLESGKCELQDFTFCYMRVFMYQVHNLFSLDSLIISDVVLNKLRHMCGSQSCIQNNVGFNHVERRSKARGSGSR
jgi:hypothetical protein